MINHIGCHCLTFSSTALYCVLSLLSLFLSLSLSLSSSFLSALRVLSLSLSLSLYCSVSSSLLFICLSFSLFLLISIRMLSFYSLSLFFSRHIFICMTAMPSMLLLVFHAQRVLWVSYGHHMFGQVYYYYYIDKN